MCKTGTAWLPEIRGGPVRVKSIRGPGSEPSHAERGSASAEGAKPTARGVQGPAIRAPGGGPGGEAPGSQAILSILTCYLRAIFQPKLSPVRTGLPRAWPRTYQPRARPSPETEARAAPAPCPGIKSPGPEPGSLARPRARQPLIVIVLIIPKIPLDDKICPRVGALECLLNMAGNISKFLA